MKLTIFTKRAYDFIGTDGGQVRGMMYGAFKPNGQAIEFSSKDPDKKIWDDIEFNPEHVQEVNLRTKIFGGKVKFQEVAE